LQADSFEYQGIRNLKSVFSVVLTATEFKDFLELDNNRAVFANLLQRISIFNSSPEDYQTVTQHTLTVLHQKLHDQLQEDLSLLRRIAKIVKERPGMGLNLKAILKSGLHVSLDDVLRLLFIFLMHKSDRCFKLPGVIHSFQHRRHLSKASGLGEHMPLLDPNRCPSMESSHRKDT